MAPANIIGMVREFETLYQDMPRYFIGQCVLPVELIFLFFQVQTVFAGLGVFRAQAAAGNVRILLVAQKTRLKSAPEVPTSEEAGLPGHEAITWFGIVAPRGTSDRIVATLNRQDHVMQDAPRSAQTPGRRRAGCPQRAACGVQRAHPPRLRTLSRSGEVGGPETRVIRGGPALRLRRRLAAPAGYCGSILASFT